MFAVVKTGGKQYRISENQKFAVEKLPGNPGETCVLDHVLMIEDGASVQVGAPVLEGAKVIATISEQTRTRKVLIFKKKRRHTYRRKKGHRQDMTVLVVHQIARAGDKINEIVVPEVKTVSPAQDVMVQASVDHVTPSQAAAPTAAKEGTAKKTSSKAKKES